MRTPFKQDISSNQINVPFELDIKMKNARFVRIANASQNFLTLDLRDGNVVSLLPGEVNVFVLDNFVQKLGVNIDSTLGSANPPVTQALIGYAYSEGEKIPAGSYPFIGPNLSGVQVNNVLTQAQQVIQTGQPQPTAVVEATPSATFVGASQEAIYNNDGSVYAGAGPGNAHPEHHWAADNAGNLSAVAFKTQPSNQETGMVGSGASNAVAAQLVLATCNAKTVWPSAPSSISLVDIAVTNAGAPSITDISTLGFSLFWSPSGAGGSIRRETYTTVGL